MHGALDCTLVAILINPKRKLKYDFKGNEARTSFLLFGTDL